jgi:nitrite reductase/ring-hydroxylating ferredoxin subunit
VGDLVDVALVADIPAGSGRLVEARGRLIAVFNDGGRFYGLDHACTHRGGPLANGKVADGRVTCPWHGAQFDLATGSPVSPLFAPVSAYRVVIEGDRVKIEL